MRYNFKNQRLKIKWDKKTLKFKKINYKTGPLQPIEEQLISLRRELLVKFRMNNRWLYHYNLELIQEYRNLKEQENNLIRMLSI